MTFHGPIVGWLLVGQLIICWAMIAVVANRIVIDSIRHPKKPFSETITTKSATTTKISSNSNDRVKPNQNSATTANINNDRWMLPSLVANNGHQLPDHIAIQPGLVRFSASKPRSLPDLKSLANSAILRNRNRNLNHRKIKKRSSPSSGSSSGFGHTNYNYDYSYGYEYDFMGNRLIQDVCPSVSDWVARTEAMDPFGQPVEVVQRIILNNTMVNQYFYETVCQSTANRQVYDEYSKQHQPINQQNHGFLNLDDECRGVDKQAWNSLCRENYIWTYGKVKTTSGEIGWSVIAIRGSCGCAIWPRTTSEHGLLHSPGRGRRLSPSTDGSSSTSTTIGIDHEELEKSRHHRFYYNNQIDDPFF